jgi:hypothetical protein
MRTRASSALLATVVGALLALPAIAAAAPSRTAQIKTQLASYLSQTRYIPPNVRMAPIAPSQIRIRTSVDKTHGADGHVHIVGHSVRNVSFQAKGLATPVRGKAVANTLLTGNGPTTVSNIKVLVPKSWGQPPTK